MSLLINKYSLAVLCLFISLSGYSQTYVNVSAAINGGGTSWADAYNNLEDALNNASLGDEIWVAQGTYVLTSSTSEFNIPNGVAVYGGFSGSEALLTQRNWQSNATILDGDDLAFTVVFFGNTNSSTILDGFTITGGNANGTTVNLEDKAGGGIFIQETGGVTCNPSIKNCTVSGNFSTNGGGGVYINTSTGITAPSFENCTFSGNSSDFDGGGVYVNGSGGGTSNTSFKKCVFFGNSTIFSGGALYNNGNAGGTSNIMVQQCNFFSNQANATAGAVYNNGSAGGNASPTIIDCSFYNNRGNQAAGAIYNNATGLGSVSNPVITNCTFNANNADQNGGAIYNNGSSNGICSPLISNSIIYGNNVTNDNNDSYIMRNVDATPTIRFSLVDATSCSDLEDLNNGTTILTCGSGMIYNQNPRFINAAAGNLRIEEPSPAIHAGNDALNSNAEDLDCNPRNVLGIDMGAYEVEEGSLPIELGDFRAYLENGHVTVSWTTLAEINNDYFEVERSGNGRDFEVIETVQGAGNATTARNYKIYDFNPLPGKNYYRLKDISFIGEIGISPVRIVETDAQSVTVYPNPADDYIRIDLSDFPVSNATIEINNAFGQVIHSEKISLEESAGTIKLDAIKTLLPGAYYITVSAPKTKRVSARFQKVNQD